MKDNRVIKIGVDSYRQVSWHGPGSGRPNSNLEPVIALLSMIRNELFRRGVDLKGYVNTLGHVALGILQLGLRQCRSR